MTQEERLYYLIEYLRAENPRFFQGRMPETAGEQQHLLRALMNVRPPQPAAPAFLAVQDAYLKEELRQKGTQALSSLTPCEKGLYLWKGDITTLETDVIVNAANSALLGCFIPCHGCIDNAIHSAAGIQLRLACARLMSRQQGGEPPGQGKLTPAFNLPSKAVLHTVGPIIQGAPTEEDCVLLASCYLSCLKLAQAHHFHSIAFCCIATGEFHFPPEKAARIAVEIVRMYQQEHASEMEVVFNVFKDSDFDLYRKLLRRPGKTI